MTSDKPESRLSTCVRPKSAPPKTGCSCLRNGSPHHWRQARLTQSLPCSETGQRETPPTISTSISCSVCVPADEVGMWNDFGRSRFDHIQVVPLASRQSAWNPADARRHPQERCCALQRCKAFRRCNDFLYPHLASCIGLRILDRGSWYAA